MWFRQSAGHLISIHFSRGVRRLHRSALLNGPLSLDREEMAAFHGAASRNAACEKLRVSAESLFEELEAELQNRMKARNEAAPSPDIDRTRLLVKRSLTSLGEGLVERDTEVRLLVLAALCGEHLLLLGPPGTAKSEICRRLARLSPDSKYFERQLTRFSLPEELFGPLSLSALERDEYRRQTAGYLPEAEICFLDEIFKANSAILNSLLCLVNERVFYDGGAPMRVPLLCLVGASNELPESDELAALWDRFLFRRKVEPVSAAGRSELLRLSASMAAEAAPPPPLDAEVAVVFRPEALRELRRSALNEVEVGEDVLAVVDSLVTWLSEGSVAPESPVDKSGKLRSLRTRLAAAADADSAVERSPVQVSDRRAVKALNALRVAAFCDGRLHVSLVDVLLLQHMLWSKPEERDMILHWTLRRFQTAADGTDESMQLRFMLEGTVRRAWRVALGRSKPSLSGSVREEIQLLREALLDAMVRVEIEQADSKLVLQRSLWLNPDDIEVVVASLEEGAKTRRDALRILAKTLSRIGAAVEADASPTELAAVAPESVEDLLLALIKGANGGASTDAALAQDIAAVVGVTLPASVLKQVQDKAENNGYTDSREQLQSLRDFM